MSRVAALAVFLSVPLFTEAQAPRTAALGKATARAKEVLSLVTTVRELRNGDLMVADPIERQVMVFGGSLQARRVLGKEGGGPGEYRQPDAVWPMPGDSTLVVDLGNARLSILGPTGVYARSIPMASGGAGGPVGVMFPGGVDAQGRVYYQPPAGGGPGGLPDSANIMRFDPKAGTAQAVAKAKTPDLDRQESGGANSRQVRIRAIPLSATDGWAVAPNGDVAVARSGMYRMDWVSNGVTRSGPAVAATRAKIGEAEKREWVQQQMLTGGISMNVEDNNGQRTMSFGRARPQQEPSTDEYKWPATKPFFEANSLRIDATGRVWVRRLGPANAPRQYDVFNTSGAHVATVNFPAGRVLLGFGASALYAAEVDEDGQYFLERYALPL
ncbi:MAG: hypothetical protein IPK85_20285 [Gemmatimonadetes bacterium]|nr:hypothetical protein [Gemmatimonadota bacterium]